MKPFTNLIFALSAFLFASCQSNSNYERVDSSEIDHDRLQFATSISKSILSAQKEGSFYLLNEEEATEKMVSGLDEALQKDSYQQIKSAFGDYQDLVFDHLKKPTDGTLYEMYRFKGIFNPQIEVEVRTVLDANGKLAGFFVKPWKE